MAKLQQSEIIIGEEYIVDTLITGKITAVIQENTTNKEEFPFKISAANFGIKFSEIKGKAK